ncbi:MAG TPA: hypothetical protein VF069_22410 [Streptosporangiaceae bacterium]
MSGANGVRERLGLAVTGTVVLCAGAVAVAGGLGAFGPQVGAEPVLDAASVRILARLWWLWPAIAAVGSTLAFIGVLALVGQVRGWLSRYVLLGRIAPRMAMVVAQAEFADEVARLPGVLAVRARLTGTRPRPRLAVVVTCEPVADIGLLREEIAAGAAPRLRIALARADLRTVIRFRFAEPRG